MNARSKAVLTTIITTSIFLASTAAIAQQSGKNRHFVINEFSLTTTKAQLLSGNSKDYWKCAPSASNPRFHPSEICSLQFEVATRLCDDVTYQLGNGQQLKKEECKQQNITVADLPADIQKLSTVFGNKYRQIQAVFYQGQIAELQFYIKMTDFDSAYANLTKSYGKPDVERTLEGFKNVVWSDENETLYIQPPNRREYAIGIQNKGLMAARMIK
jgi:hypothetical protein